MNDDTKACPACGETIKAAAVKCRFCNEDIRKFEEMLEADTEQVLFEGRPATIFSAWQLPWILLVVPLLVYWIRSLSVRYEITTQRIKVEKGLFSLRKNNVELFRIDDFDVHKPFGMRLLGFGVLRLRSTDRNVEDLSLYGIRDIEGIAERLRECSHRERERRGVKVWASA